MQYILQLLPFILIFAVFWFFLIRPQRKKQQQHEEMLDNLNIGDDIITIGGIKAKIIKIRDETVRLRIASNVDIEVMKNAISRLDQSDAKDNKKEVEDKENKDSD
ncbi:MAG: preprotein translocase subunit YajC [Halanaerobiaceae bacterium]